MTNTPMTSREAFEAWFLGENTHVVLQQDKDGNYLYSSAYSAWQAFNAGYQSCEQQSQAVIAELVEALEEAKSVINSINRAEMYKLTVEDDDEPVFYQRKEWVDWAYKEILPIVTSAIAKVKGK